MEFNEEKPKGPYRFKPGQSGNPAGRPPGPNKINKEVRERFKEIVEGQMGNVMDALDRVALDDPAKYIDVLTKLSAFFTPKLTEDVNKQQPPVFILPAGAQPPRLDENKGEQESEDDE